MPSSGSGSASGLSGGAARASMATLITRLRRMIQDLAAVDQEWDDEELQEALDRHQTVHRYRQLCMEESIAPGGAVTYLRYHADGEGSWETDAEIVNNNYTVLTPTTSDYLTGRWTFAAEPAWPLYISGQTYDLFGAAADVLEEWAARVKCQIDVKSEGQDLKLSQQRAALLELAEKYRQKQKPVTVTMTRNDMAR